MVDVKGSIICDVCERLNINKKFRKVLIHIVNNQDVINESYSNCEKEMDVCNDCILNLNFRSSK